jgi:hypothetical protein
MAIWRSFIAEKAMPSGDHLLLKKRWRFGYDFFCLINAGDLATLIH